MTREQRAEYAEWCRQRANDLVMLQELDFNNPALERELSGVEYRTFVHATIAASVAQYEAFKAIKDLRALAERIEANAD